MKSNFSDLTYKIVAFQEISEIKTSEIVEWALEMVELGYESDNLFMLASFEKDSNFYEIESYLIKALEELKIDSKNGKEALISYSCYYVLKISENINVKENLTELYNYCQKWDYEETIYDFYLLYWAWSDFDYFEYSSYWHEANKENIEAITVEKANEWINKYKTLCTTAV